MGTMWSVQMMKLRPMMKELDEAIDEYVNEYLFKVIGRGSTNIDIEVEFKKFHVYVDDTVNKLMGDGKQSVYGFGHDLECELECARLMEWYADGYVNGVVDSINGLTNHGKSMGLKL